MPSVPLLPCWQPFSLLCFCSYRYSCNEYLTGSATQVGVFRQALLLPRFPIVFETEFRVPQANFETQSFHLHQLSTGISGVYHHCTGDRTQGLVLARQTVYPLSYIVSLLAGVTRLVHPTFLHKAVLLQGSTVLICKNAGRISLSLGCELTSWLL